VVKLEEVLSSISKNSSSIPVGLKPFTTFNLTTGENEASWIEPSEDEVSNYLSQIGQELFPYQLKEEKWENSEVLIESALSSVGNEYLVRSGIKPEDYRISIVAGSISKTIHFKPDQFSIHDGDLINLPNTTSLTFDPRLLKRIITRAQGYKGFTQYHFNQAEIGSHIQWSRNGPYNPVSSLLNFMQTKI